MKKFAALILALVMAFCLCACSDAPPIQVTYENLSVEMAAGFHYDEDLDGYCVGNATVYFYNDEEGELAEDEEYFTPKEYCEYYMDMFELSSDVVVDSETGIAYSTGYCEGEGEDGKIHDYGYIYFAFSKEEDNSCEYYLIECSAPDDEFSRYEDIFWNIAKSASIV